MCTQSFCLVKGGFSWSGNAWELTMSHVDVIMEFVNVNQRGLSYPPMQIKTWHNSAYTFPHIKTGHNILAHTLRTHKSGENVQRTL